MTTNWRQFSRLEWSATVAEVVRVLGVEIPSEGRPVSFRCGGFIAAHTSAGLWVVMGLEGGSRYVDGPQEVLKAAKLAKGTPSGDALRQWLEMWAPGWEAQCSHLWWPMVRLLVNESHD